MLHLLCCTLILFSIYLVFCLYFLCIPCFVWVFFLFSHTHTHTHIHTHTHTAGLLLCSRRSIHPPVCPPDHPTDSLSHFCPKNSVCHGQKTLTHRWFVMKISQPCRLRQWTFPWKTASVPTSESDSFQFTDGDYVTVISSEKRNFATFQDVWWVRISITPHYNSIHMIINCPRV